MTQLFSTFCLIALVWLFFETKGFNADAPRSGEAIRASAVMLGGGIAVCLLIGLAGIEWFWDPFLIPVAILAKLFTVEVAKPKLIARHSAPLPAPPRTSLSRADRRP